MRTKKRESVEISNELMTVDRDLETLRGNGVIVIYMHEKKKGEMFQDTFCPGTWTHNSVVTRLRQKRRVLEAKLKKVGEN